MSRRVLIAHVPYEVRGGEDIHVEILTEAYRSMGIEPLLFPQDRNPPGRALAPIAKSVVPAMRPEGIIEAWNRWKPSFIHLHNAFPVLGPNFFRWVIEAAVPMIMTVHNHRFFCTNGIALRNGRVCRDCMHSSVAWRPLLYNCNQDLVKSTYHAIALSEMRIGNLYSRAVRKFIAPSPYIREQLIESGIPNHQVTTILNPVEISAELVENETEHFQFDVLYAGRLSQEKGLRELLKAFELLPDLKLAIVGDGPERPLVEECARQNTNIQVLGAIPREKVTSLIRRARIGVLSSVCNEILPTFVLECFAQGRRCVVSDQESMQWFSQGDFPGYLADVRDPEKFAVTIKRALMDGSPRLEQTQRIRDLLRLERFSADLERVIQSLL